MYRSPRPSFKLERGRESLFYTAVLCGGLAAVSRAAEDYVDAYLHPHVKGAALALFKALAQLIPEGQTTTPLIGMGELATRAHIHRRTVWSWLLILVELGEVRVIDGLPGRPARYTLVHVAGAQPLTDVPLPLVGAAAPKRPRTKHAPAVDTSPGLFDTLPEPSRHEPPAKIGWLSRSHVAIQHVIGWITGITGITGWRSQGSQGSQVDRPIFACDPCDLAPPLGEDTRAGAYNHLNTNTRTTTTAAPPAESPSHARDPAGSPPCRWFGKSHAWCAGRVHVPMGFHEEERRKLARQPGETDADLDRRLFARYTEILAAIPETEDLPDDETEFDFWKRVLRSAKARAPTRQARAPIPDNDLFARAKEERRQRYGG